jgi:hypothetical protein
VVVDAPWNLRERRRLGLRRRAARVPLSARTDEA